MKKSTLALSIAAALGGLGMAGNALAVTSFSATADAGTTATSMAVNANGIGHQLVFPYFTAQNGNATYLTITNTDTTNGKLVKVRFRGAANSDDIYDFQLALSPGDIWTAAVTKDAASGAASLATTDKSCTLPSSVNGAFNTQRVDGLAATQTLEGYVEVLNMADIKPNASGSTVFTTGLYTAIKHVNGVAPCTAAVLATKLGKDNSYANLTAAQADGSNAVGLGNPTTGLTGDWIIMNQTTTAAWSGAATAIQAMNGSAAGAARLTFWPQITGTPDSFTAGAAVAAFTADPILTSGAIAAQNYDLPDLSTVYVNGPADAGAQADATTAVLAVTSVANQYVTDTGIAAVTDILFSQPMRRYSAAVNYKATSTTSTITGATTYYPLASTGTIAAAVYRGARGTGASTSTTASSANLVASSGGETIAQAAGTAYYAGPAAGASTGGNLAINGRTLCLNTIAAPANNTIFDREETTPSTSATSASFVISPNIAASTPKVYVCGEAAVVSINNGGTTGNSALSSSIARSDFTSTSLTTYVNGWVYFLTPSASAPASGPSGLPVIGQSFIRMANGAVNYGVGYTNKVTR